MKVKAMAKTLNGRPFCSVHCEWATLIHCAAALARRVFPLTAGFGRNGAENRQERYLFFSSFL
jgi:hypothetical protein